MMQQLHRKQLLVITLFLIFLILLIYVIFFFPSKEIEIENESQIENQIPVENTQELNNNFSEDDVLELIGESVIQMQELESLQTSIWSPELWSDYLAQVNIAEEYFFAQQYDQSYFAYEAILELGQSILNSATPIFNELIAESEIAIINGSIEEARAYLSQARVIQPDDSRLSELFLRAENYQQASQKYIETRELISRDLLDDALTSVEVLMLLDSEYPDGMRLYNEVINLITERDFGLIMADAFNELNQRNANSALNLFDQALSLMPASQTALDGYIQAEQLNISQQINLNLFSAEENIESEQWESAINFFDNALALNSNLTEAIDGKNFAISRQIFDQKINFYIANPSEMLDEQALLEVAEILEESSSYNFSNDSLMPDNIRLLDEIYEVMITPVELMVISDNRTYISILRTSDLGMLDTRSIMLKPGNYIITGSREGFRDVRIDLQVRPNSINSVEVICSERF